MVCGVRCAVYAVWGGCAGVWVWVCVCVCVCVGGMFVYVCAHKQGQICIYEIMGTIGLGGKFPQWCPKNRELPFPCSYHWWYFRIIGGILEMEIFPQDLLYP